MKCSESVSLVEVENGLKIPIHTLYVAYVNFVTHSQARGGHFQHLL
jgi:hypothetical protein